MSTGAKRVAWVRVVILNVMVLCALVVGLNAGAVVIYKVRSVIISLKIDMRADLPNYADAPWARQHFKENIPMPRDYSSYVGWRRKAFSGQTVNIDSEGRRVTRSPINRLDSVHIFGGSTVWGTGGRDAETVPSQLARLFPDRNFVNWGESGYTAHQSLETLMNLYAMGERPDVVVFVDGVNDVGVKCRRGNAWNSRAGEQEIARKIDAGNVLRFSQLVEPVIVFVRKVSERLARSTDYADCDVNPDKAAAVARALVADWRMARLLVESWGGKFLAFLQPVAYFSQTKIDHIELDSHLGDQYRAVYPQIKELILDDASYLDITDAFDRDEYIYIDFCHFSPRGGQLLAEAIAPTLPREAR